jgi:hypothetical protein
MVTAWSERSGDSSQAAHSEKSIQKPVDDSPRHQRRGIGLQSVYADGNDKTERGVWICPARWLDNDGWPRADATDELRRGNRRCSNDPTDRSP